MRSIFSLCICLVAISLLLPGKGVLSKNAGRTIKLTEVKRITDEGGEFFFKSPNAIKIAPDESIYLKDEAQFLRFDRNGRFQGNLYKKGEGPGECIYIRDYFFVDKGIIILSFQPSKILKTDMNGNLLQETRIENFRGLGRTLGFHNDRFWTATMDMDRIEKVKNGVVDFKMNLGWMALDGKREMTDMVFVEKTYIEKSVSESRSRIMIRTFVPLKYVTDGSRLYVNDSSGYSIHCIDLDKIISTGTIARQYDHVPYREEKKTEEDEARAKIPKPEFFNDIQKLFVLGGNLWVFTSSVVKGKGVLVDVFSSKGEYLDYFYLPLPQVNSVEELIAGIVTIEKNNLFTIEKDEDENLSLVQYVMEL